MTPPLDLELADESIRGAAELIGRRLPPSYPADPATAFRESPGRRGAGVVELVAQAAEDTLGKAVALEAAAQAAQRRAIRALRHLGAASATWPRVGELVGLSQQGAHKRFSVEADAPRPQLTIADEEAAPSPMKARGGRYGGASGN